MKAKGEAMNLKRYQLYGLCVLALIASTCFWAWVDWMWPGLVRLP